MTKLTLALWMIVVLAIGSGDATAQDAGGDCYPQAVAVLTVRTTLRTDIGFEALAVREVDAGDEFAVTASREHLGHCWVRTNDGWLYGGYLETAPTLAATPTATATIGPTARPTATRRPTATPLSACYDAEWAFVTGAMNIRRQPTTASERVGATKTVDAYKVHQSTQGPSYCWLKVRGGWMAVTGFVRSTMPAVQLPKIEGKADFIAEVNTALRYLKEEAPGWYWYVVKPARLIEEGPSWESTSYAYGSQDRMQMGMYSIDSTLELLALMVHDACHLHQYDAGQRLKRDDDEARTKAEIECYTVERDMLVEVSPGSPLIRGVSAQLRAIQDDGWAARPTRSAEHVINEFMGN